MKKETHYIVIGNDCNGRDEIEGIFHKNNSKNPLEDAKKLFKELVKSGTSYARYESVEVIGGNEDDGFEYDNNETIESFYYED